MCAQQRQACPTLLDPMDCSPPGSSVRGILQARIPEWVAVPSSRDLPNSGIEPMSPGSPALQAESLATKPPGKPYLQEFPVLYGGHGRRQIITIQYTKFYNRDAFRVQEKYSSFE